MAYLLVVAFGSLGCSSESKIILPSNLHPCLNNRYLKTYDCCSEQINLPESNDSYYCVIDSGVSIEGYIDNECVYVFVEKYDTNEDTVLVASVGDKVKVKDASIQKKEETVVLLLESSSSQQAVLTINSTETKRIDLDENHYFSMLSSNEETIFVASSDGLLVSLDKDLTQVKDTYTDEEIVSISCNDAGLYTLENNNNGIKLIRRSIKSLLSEVEYTVQYDDGHQPNEMHIFAVDEGVLLSTSIGIYFVDVYSSSVKMLINSYDLGMDATRNATISKELLYFEFCYYDVFEDKWSVGLACYEIGVDNNTDNQKQVLKLGVFCPEGVTYLDYVTAYNRMSDVNYIEITDFKYTMTPADCCLFLAGESEFDIVMCESELARKLSKQGFYYDLSESISTDNMTSNIQEIVANYDSFDYLFLDYTIGFLAASDKYYSDDYSYDSECKELLHAEDEASINEYALGILINDINNGEVTDYSIRNLLHVICWLNDDYYESGSMKEEVNAGNVLFIGSEVDNIEEYYSLYCLFESQLVCVPCWGYNTPSVNPGNTFGINNDSSNIDACIDFLIFLYSDKVQKTIDDAIPINQNALEDKIDTFVNETDSEALAQYNYYYRILSDSEAAAYGADVLSVINDMENGNHNAEESEVVWDSFQSNSGLYAEELKAIAENYTTLVESSTTVKYSDSNLMAIINEEAGPLIDGSKTEDETVEVLLNRISLYLDENE